MKKLLTTSATILTLIASQGNSEAKTLSEMKEAVWNFVKGRRSLAPVAKKEVGSILLVSPHRTSIPYVDPWLRTISPRTKVECLLSMMDEVIKKKLSSKTFGLAPLEEQIIELKGIGLASGATTLKRPRQDFAHQGGTEDILRDLTKELEEIGLSSPSSPYSSARANQNKGVAPKALQMALQQQYAKEPEVEEEGSLSSTHSSSLSLTSSGSGGSFVEFEDQENAHVPANVYNTLGNGFRDTFFLSSDMDEEMKEAVWKLKLRQREAQYLKAKYPYPGFINIKDKDGKKVDNVEAGYKALFRLESN